MWTEQNNALYRKFVFKDFTDAFAFMIKVAFTAEKVDHHPRWTNVYNTVEIWLNTHDANDTITRKDQELSLLIDEIMEGRR
jgi:4a-hydroxytetrahydrobiopterin dehydratase